MPIMPEILIYVHCTTNIITRYNEYG